MVYKLIYYLAYIFFFQINVVEFICELPVIWNRDFVNLLLPGTPFKYFCVSCDVWAEWLSRISLILSPSGYFLSIILRKYIKSELLWVSLI